MTLSLPPSIDDQGSPIIKHKLFVDAGDNFSSQFTELTNYDGISTTYTATSLVDKLITGKVYRFVTAANNAYGDSPYSF